MCICLNESGASNTKVYVGSGTRNGQDVHVLAYQCSVTALAPSGKGAMLIPVPSTERLTGDNFIDTSAFPSFLKDISDASKQVSRSLSFSMSRGFSKALIVDRGTATYVYAANFSEAAAALDQVREDRRPNFTQEFISGCSDLYQDPIVIACWSGSVTMDPLLLWYIPSDASTFRLPTMDAHDGLAPRLGVDVETDHVLSVSASDKHGYAVHYSERLPDDVRSLLPRFVQGAAMKGAFKNGDMFVNVADTLNQREPAIRRAVSATAKPSEIGTLDGWEDGW